MSQPPYPGPPYDGQSSSSGRPSSGQPYQGQPYQQGQPYSGQPGEGQPYSGQPYQGQPDQGQPYPGQPYPGQPYQGQSNPGQPDQGQPYGQPSGPVYGQPYGQPNPDVPSSVPPQPGYPPTQAYPGQPDYGQQPPPYGAGQPYGQQPYGQGDYAGQPAYGNPVPPKKKSKVLPIVLVSVAIVLVLCVGGVAALIMIGKNADDDTVKTSDTVTPTAPAQTTDTPEPDQTSKAAPAKTVRIVEPKTLGGRPKLTDDQFSSMSDQLESSFKSIPGATNAIGGLYGTVSKRNIVAITAAQAPIDDPKTALDQLFLGPGIGGIKINDITTASSGKLGGETRCGSMSSSGVDMAICSWADDGSLGMVMWYFKSVSKAKAEFPTLRAQIEKKS